MSVRLVSCSAAMLEGLDIGTGGDHLVAHAARVSNPNNQFNTETSEKLLKYLIKHKHWSPFEMAHATLEITTTRDISRQILRHRSFSFQEFSQRYAESTEYSWREARLQDEKNRQNSVETDDRELKNEWQDIQASVLITAKDAYKWALHNGIAKEQARVVLPEGLTKTTLYMAGNLRSWIHYIELREKNGTQKEHMEIASECKEVLSEVFPTIMRLVE